MWWSLQLISAMSLVWTKWWLAHCPGCLLWPVCTPHGIEELPACTPSKPGYLPACTPHAGSDICQPTLHVSPVSPSSELLDYVSIAKNQLTCPSTKIAEASYSLRLVHINVRGHQLLCAVSRVDQRSLIPEMDKKRLFQAFHALSLLEICTCHMSPDVCTCPLAWYVLRHHRFVQGLPAVCKGES
jgi:hypothetical protein